MVEDVALMLLIGALLVFDEDIALVELEEDCMVSLFMMQTCSYPSLVICAQMPVSQSEPIHGFKLVSSDTVMLNRLGAMEQLKFAGVKG